MIIAILIFVDDGLWPLIQFPPNINPIFINCRIVGSQFSSRVLLFHDSISIKLMVEIPAFVKHFRNIPHI